MLKNKCLFGFFICTIRHAITQGLFASFRLTGSGFSASVDYAGLVLERNGTGADFRALSRHQCSTVLSQSKAKCLILGRAVP